jgi:hypothetical protein
MSVAPPEAVACNQEPSHRHAFAEASIFLYLALQVAGDLHVAASNAQPLAASSCGAHRLWPWRCLRPPPTPASRSPLVMAHVRTAGAAAIAATQLTSALCLTARQVWMAAGVQSISFVEDQRRDGTNFAAGRPPVRVAVHSTLPTRKTAKFVLCSALRIRFEASAARTLRLRTAEGHIFAQVGYHALLSAFVVCMCPAKHVVAFAQRIAHARACACMMTRLPPQSTPP